MARPAFTWLSPTFMSSGRAPISITSTTGRPEPASMRRVRSSWRQPATMRPDGDQPSRVATRSASRARSYCVLPSNNSYPAGSSTSPMPSITSMNTALASDGTTTGTIGLAADASAPANRFRTSPRAPPARPIASRSEADTVAGSLSARDTVIAATPARSATSRNVTLAARVRCRVGWPDAPIRTLLWDRTRRVTRNRPDLVALPWPEA